MSLFELVSIPRPLLKLGSGNRSRSLQTARGRDHVNPGNSSTSRENNRASDGERQIVQQLAEENNPVPTSSAPVDQVQRWNFPRANIPRLGFAYLSFIIAGMNDAAVGVSSLYAPFQSQALNADAKDRLSSHISVSMIFLTPFVGYSIAAFTNARIHMLWGQRGVSLMAPICHIVAFVAMAVHPPFYALLALFALSGFGNGLTDAAYCAWAGAMANSNQILGFMHSCYSLGALCAPLIATSMVVRSGLPWYTFYYIMVGLSGLEWLGLSISFWRKTGKVYQTEHPRREDSNGSGTKGALKNKITWLCACFIFLFMGIEVGLGGWIVTFMLRERNASGFAAGASSSGFWAGMVAGRAGLGFVTGRFGERLCIAIYIACCVALQLLFWLVPQFVVSAVAISFLGFFIGPLYPAVITFTAKLLPKSLHVSAIGFALALGGAGGTVFPFSIGTIAESAGVWVLQPIVLGLFVIQAINWLLFPKIQKKD